jgi:hypothetical protein
MQVGSPLPCRVQSQSGPKPALGWRRGIPWHIKTKPHTPTTTKAIRIVFIFGIMAHIPRAASSAGYLPQYASDEDRHEHDAYWKYTNFLHEGLFDFE